MHLPLTFKGNSLRFASLTRLRLPLPHAGEAIKHFRRRLLLER